MGLSLYEVRKGCLMAIVRRGPKAYQVKVYRGGKHVTGGTFKTLGEARERERNMLAAGVGGNTTVSQFAAKWLQNYPRPKESTNLHYEQQIKGFVAEFGKSRLSDLSRSAMRAWAIAHRGPAEVARAMLGDAERDGLIRDNPLAKMRLPSSRGRRDIVALTDAEINGLVQAAIKVHGDYGREIYAPMLQIAAYTGVRPGELFALRRQDYDERKQTLYVQRQYNHKVAKFTTPKNGKAREIALVPEATRAFEALNAGDDLLFQTKHGAHFTGRVAHYYWHPVRIAFGRPDLDFYELRHHFGTMLARKGVSAPAIALMMGHTDGGKLALGRYIHLAAEDAKAEVRAAFDTPRLHVVGK